MARVALIAGTGAHLLGPTDREVLASKRTRWGSASADIETWTQSGHQVLFLARHGQTGVIPPHRVNYRANIQLLAELQPDWVVALNAVGGISPALASGSLVIPSQLIDYTWGREHTFYDGAESLFIDFTMPYDDILRQKLIIAAAAEALSFQAGGVCAVTQGPRLETAAEIDRLERDGCSIVGMTAMPEAALARERGLRYAGLAVVVNPAAGRGHQSIHVEIERFLATGMQNTSLLLDRFLAEL